MTDPRPLLVELRLTQLLAALPPGGLRIGLYSRTRYRFDGIPADAIADALARKPRG